LDVEEEFVEETINAPSLWDARQQLKGLAVFLADNPQFSAQDGMLLQMLATKVSKMTVSRINQSHQQNITAFFSSNWTAQSCAWFVDKPAVQVNALYCQLTTLLQQSKTGVRIKFDW